MPNSAYIKGRTAEYKTLKILRAMGYWATRSPGSKGMDVIACNGDKFRFISVTRNRKLTKDEGSAICKMRKKYGLFNHSFEWWFFRDGIKEPKIEIL